MGFFVLGVGLAVGLYLLVRVFVSADPRGLARMVRWGAVVVGCVVLAVLLATGRLGPAMALGAFLLPVAVRWRAIAQRFRAARGPTGGQTSRVETIYLRMTLDHDSGAMTGEVLRGAFAGRSLSSLGPEALAALLDECRASDIQSVQVLEAWLDRQDPDWRARAEQNGRAGADRSGANGPNGVMTREEAAEILGVAPDAAPELVKDAHRRLMMKVHPDHGGSNYLAAKINQAKDRLLDR